MASVTYKIGGKYDDSALKKAEGGVKQFQKAINAFKTTAIVTAIASVTKKALEFEEAFAEADAVVKRIDFAASLNPTLSRTSAQLQDFASRVSATMRGAISVDEINAEIAKLSFDKTGDQIEKLIPAAIDLSAAMGTSLSDAVTQLNNTFSGTTGTLGKMFPELKELSKEALASGEAIDIISEKTRGMGEAFGESAAGSIQAFKNEMDNLKEAMGGYVSDVFQPMRDAVTDLVKGWADALNNLRAYKTAARHQKEGTLDRYDVQTLLDEAVQRKARLKEEYKGSAMLPGLLDDVNREIKKYTNMLTQMDIVEEEHRKETEKATKQKKEEVKTEEKIVEAKKEEEKAVVKATEVVYQFSQTVENALEPLENAVVGGLGNLGAFGTAAESGYMEVVAFLVGEILTVLQSESDEFSYFTNIIEEIIKAAIEPLAQGFSYVFEDVKYLIQPLIEVFNGVFNIFGGLYQAFSGIIGTMSRIFSAYMVPVLSLLDGLQSFVQVLVLIAEAIQPLFLIFEYTAKSIAATLTLIGNLIGNLLTAIYNAVIWIYNLFASKKNEKGYKSFNSLSSDMNKVFNSTKYEPQLEGYAATAAAEMVTASSGSASYQAARDVIVTINYNNSYVNGDARAIALNVWEEIQSAQRLGY